MSQLSKLLSSTSSTVLIAIGKIVELSFISAVLSDEMKGIYALLNLQLLLSVLISEMGIQNALFSKSQYTLEETRSLYWYNLLKSLLFWISGYIILYLLPIPDGYSKYFYLLNNLILINAIGKLFRSFLLLENKINTVSLIELTSTLIGVIFTIVLIKRLEINAFIYGVLIKHFIDNCSFFIHQVGSINLFGPIGWKSIRKTINIGFFDMFSQLINLISKELDTIIVFNFLGLEIVGVMNIGKQTILKPVRIISPVFNNIYYSLFAKAANSKEKFKSFLTSQLKMNSVIITVGYSLILVLLDVIKNIFFSNTSYTKVDSMLLLFVLLGLFRGYWSILGGFILSKGLTKKAFLFNLMYFAFSASISYVVLIYYNELIYLGMSVISLLIFQLVSYKIFYRLYIDCRNYYKLTVCNAWPVIIILILKVCNISLFQFSFLSILIVVIYIYLNYRSFTNAFRIYQEG